MESKDLDPDLHSEVPTNFEELQANRNKALLTMKDALLIQYKLPDNLQEVNPQLLPYVTLNKIMTCEYENGLCCYDKSIGLDSSDSEDDDDENSISEDDNDSVKGDFDDDGHKNIDSEDDNDDKMGKTGDKVGDRKDSCTKVDNENTEHTVHPVDNLLTQIKYSDNILQQNLVLKLSLCQVAIPLLLPDHANDSVTFLLWAMQSIVKKYKIKSSKPDVYNESPLVDHPFPVVSFLRIGSTSLSKSDILNHVIGEFDFFFFRGCRRVKSEKKLTEGLVDLCCYLPGSNTALLGDDPILFFNLHGDARKSKRQLKFIQALSILSIIFIAKKEINDITIQTINDLVHTDNKVVLFTEKCSKDKLRHFHKHVKINQFDVGKDMHYFKEKVEKLVNKTINNCKKTVKLNEFSRFAKECEIIVDKDDKDCQNGYEHAKLILDQIEKFSPIDAKSNIFPLQGSKGWQKWAELDKMHHREFGKQTSNLEKYNAESHAKKLEVRKQMQHFCDDLMEPVNIFLNALLRFDSTTRNYFLAWLKLLLGEYNRKLYVKYSVKQVHSAVIGIEHFFREMGQIYETAISLQKEFGESNENVLNYPRKMVELIADGYSMEIMDGDSTHVPIEWVSAVFKELQNAYGNGEVCVVSIVGLQSSGKSTLLNTMFGVNFSVSAGRCTRGAFMQLLSFHEDTKNVSRCDHLLIIDTEGLRAPEFQYISKQHDNELATFVVGLADVAIINIFGENQTDLSDILQAVSHGLIRINKIEVNLSCKFVYHQVAEPGAEGKTQYGRKRFHEVLDEYVQKACELEHCKGKFSSFSKLMNFNENKDVLYFPPLWHGNQPMAKINTQYATQAKKFKMSLIEHIGQCKRSHLSFVDFSVKISTIWNAVLREQFLFSFKNILEVLIRKEYDQLHGVWNMQFRQDFLEWEHQAKLLFHKNENQDVKHSEKILSEKIEKTLEKRKKQVISERDKYFKESKYSEILAEWEAKSNDKINSYYEECITRAEQSIAQLMREYHREFEVYKMMKTMYKKLDDFAADLFISNPNVKLSNQALEKRFNEEWSAWLDKIPSVNYKSPKEIEDQILRILQEKFKFDRNLLNQKLLMTSLKNWSTVFNLKAEVHFVIKQTTTLPTDREIFDYVEAIIGDWIKNFTKLTFKNVDTLQGMLHQFDHQLSELVEKFNTNKMDPIFHFTRECLFDVVLTVSKQTADFLINFEEKSKRNDIKTELETNKTTYMKLFFVFFDNRQKAQEALEKQIKQKTATLKSLQDEEQKFMAERENIRKQSKASLEDDTQIQEAEQRKLSDKQKTEAHDIEIQATNAQEENVADSLLVSHAKMIEYLCDILENAMTKTLRKNLISEIDKDITTCNSIFKTKENFKLSVLKLLLDNESFEGYKLYFTNPEESFKKCMCFFVKEHCFKNCNHSTNHAKIDYLANQASQELLTSVQGAIIETCIDNNNLSFPSWINEFSTNINKKCESIYLHVQNLSDIDIPWKSLNDAKAFKDLFFERINSNLIKINSEELYKEIEADLTEYMWRNLNGSLLGCTTYCPFCYEMCDAESKCTKDDKHYIKLHRPLCLGKILKHPTRNVAVDICTTLVGSDVSKFRNKDSKWHWKLYKDYKDFYPDWLISATTETVEPYWKWVVAHFDDDIAKWCGNGKTDSIPKEWYDIDKVTARACVNLVLPDNKK